MRPDPDSPTTVIISKIMYNVECAIHDTSYEFFFRRMCHITWPKLILDEQSDMEKNLEKNDMDVPFTEKFFGPVLESDPENIISLPRIKLWKTDGSLENNSSSFIYGHTCHGMKRQKGIILSRKFQPKVRPDWQAGTSPGGQSTE